MRRQRLRRWRAARGRLTTFEHGGRRLRGRRWLLAPTALAAVAGALGVLVAVALDNTPRLPQPQVPTVPELERARMLWQQHDPRRDSGPKFPLLLRPRDLQWMGETALRRLSPTGDAPRLAFAILPPAAPLPGGPASAEGVQGGVVPQSMWPSGRLKVQVDWPVRSPWLTWAGRWARLDLALDPRPEGLPQIVGARVGGVPLPAWLVRRLARLALARSPQRHAVAWALPLVRQVRFLPGVVVIDYLRSPDAGRALAVMLVPQQDLQRLGPYMAQLNRLLREAPPAGAASAARPIVLLQPPRALPLGLALQVQLALALQRSSQPGADAAAENRAALLSIALAAMPSMQDRLRAAAPDWEHPPQLDLRLAGRTDFPLHFTLSAVMAASDGAAWSDAMGQYKEVLDARQGSGFSFNDLAADRAGTRFGRLAVDRPAALQRRALRGFRDEDLLPPVDDLPEFLSQAEFLARYGGLGAPAYRDAMRDIEQRVDALPLWRLEAR